MSMRAAMLGLTAALAASPALAADPPVPIGQDPGGTAVAIITTGIDYTVPEIAKALARDGEGEIIAWDFVDGDNRPFGATGDQFAKEMVELLADGGLRVVPARIRYDDELWLARAAAFADRTPASIVVAAVFLEEELALLQQTARKFTRLRFVVVGQPGIAEALKQLASETPNIGTLDENFCTGHGQARAALETIGRALCGTATGAVKPEAFSHVP